MKTYTKEDFNNYHQRDDAFAICIDPLIYIHDSKGLCTCARPFGTSTFKAYEDCPNCLGFGMSPIPPFEIK